MSVEIVIRVPQRLYEALEARAKEMNMPLNDLILITLAKIVRGETRGGGGQTA